VYVVQVGGGIPVSICLCGGLSVRGVGVVLDFGKIVRVVSGSACSSAVVYAFCKLVLAVVFEGMLIIYSSPFQKQ
jgi:hypothetical protein